MRTPCSQRHLEVQHLGTSSRRTVATRGFAEINGKLGTPEWTPLVYINRSIQRTELVGLYKLADVCWVGSLRDGMNLVAKEYVACNADGDGVLVLSEFAGAASEAGCDSQVE